MTNMFKHVENLHSFSKRSTIFISGLNWNAF